MKLFGKKKQQNANTENQTLAQNQAGAQKVNAAPPITTPETRAKKNKNKNEEKPAEMLARGMVNIKDIVAPPAIEVDFNHIKIGNNFYRTLFISGYPRFVGANWLSPIINFEHTLDISFFYYPVKSKGVLDDLRRKITEMEATMHSDEDRGKIADPGVKIALDDAKTLQEQLVKGVEKFFQFSFYITIRANSMEELENAASKLESTLGSLLLISKSATLQMEEAFQSTVPVALDKLLITRNMDTTSLATTFPFTSSDLTSDDGIMYGLNKHNGSLIIFDRFSLENANTVVFAKSGSGKSYFVKLEALRLIAFGAEIIIIDPEAEYKPIAEVIGGDFISFSSTSPDRINPFDLSGIATEGENELGQKILSLHTLFKLVLGDLTPIEEAILDRALIETYRIKGITTDPDTQRTKEPPVMEDLYKVLLGAEEPEARSMSERLEKYIRGSLAGIFDQQSTLRIDNRMTVFSTQNLEDALRPIAFYIILDFVWTKVKKSLKKRILIVEEAWYLLQNEDSARFIYGIAKRARKYYLGLTTITQDVDDFLASDYGKVIVTNSSIQVLLKQHPAGIDRLADTFYLSEGEKRLLLAAERGEGLFFAGANHVAIKIMASEEEHNLITTNPEEILRMKEQREQAQLQAAQPQPGSTDKKYERFERLDPNRYTTNPNDSTRPAQAPNPMSSPMQPGPLPNQNPIVQPTMPMQSPQPTQTPTPPQNNAETVSLNTEDPQDNTGTISLSNNQV
ncbi:MAG: VirB4-like conjugal transfer ATPase, CD1110 family [Patescibacteria group bacterium]